MCVGACVEVGVGAAVLYADASADLVLFLDDAEDEGRCAAPIDGASRRPRPHVGPVRLLPAVLRSRRTLKMARIWRTAPCAAVEGVRDAGCARKAADLFDRSGP